MRRLAVGHAGSRRRGRPALASSALAAVAGLVTFLAACGVKQSSGEPAVGTAPSGGKTCILVVYFTRSGTTEELARAVADGAGSVEGTEAIVKEVGEVQERDLLDCDGLAVGSPVYYANMASEVKEFFDNWTLVWGFYPEQKMAFKPGAAFATGSRASGGKEMAIHSIHAAFLNAGMVVVGCEEVAGASATGEFKEEGRETELLPSEYRDGHDLGRRLARTAAALKGLRAGTGAEARLD